MADIRLDNLTCSGQHAVLQFRKVTEDQKDGTTTQVIRPYLIDLGSTNGTFLNKQRIEKERYYQLLPEDVVTFGLSQRQYVFMHSPQEILPENVEANRLSGE